MLALEVSTQHANPVVSCRQRTITSTGGYLTRFTVSDKIPLNSPLTSNCNVTIKTGNRLVRWHACCSISKTSKRPAKT